MQIISGYYWGKSEWDTQQNFKRNLKQKNVFKKKKVPAHAKKKKIQNNPINTEIIAQLKGFTIFTALINPQV